MLAGILKSEADLYCNLVVRNLIVFEVTSDISHLEPVKLPERLSCPRRSDLYRCANSFGRRPDNLGHPIDTIRHVSSSQLGYYLLHSHEAVAHST